MANLTGRNALVIGASSGIGLHSALSLARSGASVAIAARRLTTLEEITAAAQPEGLTLTPIPLDVRKIPELEHTIASYGEQNEHLDILVYATGISHHTPAFEMTEELWDETIDTNLKGAFFAAQAAAKIMEKARWGRIIFLSSILSGGMGMAVPQEAHYCASKGGITGLTESLALELAPLGVLVNAVAPGYIDTPMTDDVKKDSLRFQSKLNRIPLKRFGKPEEVANLITFLASEEASYITGSTFSIDGGYLAG